MSEVRKFDTSRFKGTNMQALKTQDQKVSKTIGETSGKQRAGYLEIDPGNNYFRIYPHHNAVREMAGEDIPKNDKGETFAENRVIYYVPIMVEDKDDKTGNVKKDAKGRPILIEKMKQVFDSRVHGETEKDLIDEYIKFVNAYAAEYIEENERAAFLEPIIGNWSKRISGLSAKSSWVVFADKITPRGKDASGLEQLYDLKFGKLDFGKAVRYGLNSLSAQEEANQPLGTDPFTHPEEGMAVNIIYNPNADKPQDKYSVGFYAPKLGKGQVKLFELSNEQLEQLLEFDSLYVQYKNVYSKRDFNIALEGLQNFDSKNSYNLIGEPAFVEVIEEIAAYYPDEDSENESSESDEQAGDNADDEQVTGGEQDQFDLMTREELKMWHKVNKTGLLITSKHTDDMIRDSAREIVAAQEEQSESSNEQHTEEEKGEQKPLTAKEIAAQKLRALRDKKGK